MEKHLNKLRHLVGFSIRDQKNLIVRVLTAFIGITAISYAIIYGGKTWIQWMAILGSAGALAEYFEMIFPLNEHLYQRRVGWLIGIILVSVIIRHSLYLYETMSLCLIVLFLFYLSLDYIFGGDQQQYLTDLSHSLFGIFYVGFLFSFWPKVCDLLHGKQWIFLIFIIPWFSDTAAYFVGKMIGKHKLAEAISPKKTIEGAYAGVVASIIGVFLYKAFFFQELNFIDCILLGSAGSIISQMGDLFESFIKRAMSVKDSGVIIPGHGGILDRFDGVLFCSPFIYFYARCW